MDGEALRARANVHTISELTSRRSADVVRGAVRSGELRRVHRGVYFDRGATVHDPLLIASVAALVAAGPGAAMSHAWSAALRGVGDPPSGPPVARLPAGRHARTRPDLLLHRTTGPLHAEPVRGVPCTGLTRTLVDLGASRRTAVVLMTAVRADGLCMLDGSRTVAELDELRDSPGVVVVRVVMDLLRRCGPVVRSLLEAELLVLCHRRGLCLPAANARVQTDVGWLEVDALWPNERLVVEADGWGHHGAGEGDPRRSRVAFERDRDRWSAIAAAGYRLLVVTWRQVLGAPSLVAARIEAALRLGRRGGRGHPRSSARPTAG